MNFEKYPLFGWQIKLSMVSLTRGLDAYGKYYIFKCPYYYTCIRDGK